MSALAPVQSNGDATTYRVGGVTGRGFKPGQSGNPGGKGKSTAVLAKRIQRETKNGGEVVDYLLEAMRHSRSGKERIDAATLLLAYGFGKPMQPTEVTGADGGPIEHALTVAAQAIDYRASVRGLAPPEDDAA